MTFCYTSSLNTSSVELLGSWDNFTVPYSMQKDPRRGKQMWTGCFRFDHIVFDGLSHSFSPPRDGCLQQGGRYWYFYRLTDGTEDCNSTQPCSNDCPLLPGQWLNFLELPMEAVEHTSMAPFTTDPASRYISEEIRPRPRHRCMSHSEDETTDRSLPVKDLAVQPGTPSEKSFNVATRLVRACRKSLVIGELVLDWPRGL